MLTIGEMIETAIDRESSYKEARSQSDAAGKLCGETYGKLLDAYQALRDRLPEGCAVSHNGYLVLKSNNDILIKPFADVDTL